MLWKSERASLCWALHTLYPLAVVQELDFFDLTGQNSYNSEISKLFCTSKSFRNSCCHFS